MRSKVVSIAGKNILIEEKRIKEIKKLIKDFSPEIKELWNKDIDFNNTDSIDTIFSTIEDKIAFIFGDLTQEDIENAYMSELENLFNAFMEVNFMGAKKGISLFLKQVQKS